MLTSWRANIKSVLDNQATAIFNCRHLVRLLGQHRKQLPLVYDRFTELHSTLLHFPTLLALLSEAGSGGVSPIVSMKRHTAEEKSNSCYSSKPVFLRALQALPNALGPAAIQGHFLPFL